jgi:hypothetical protein
MDPCSIARKLEQNWEDSKWKDKAEVNKKNRRSSDGPLHTCGSIPTTEHSKRLVSKQIIFAVKHSDLN